MAQFAEIFIHAWHPIDFFGLLQEASCVDESELQLKPEPERCIVERLVFSLDVSALARCGSVGEHFRLLTRTVSGLVRLSMGAGRRISVIERGS
jgi:hypothetical protein